MPRCGSQCILCDLPIRFDTYEGCEHSCSYCFAKKKRDIEQIKTGETIVQLKRFVEGGRDNETEWCDWNIPLHWGGMSDPLQPCEAKKENSYKCLKYLAQTQYPFVLSTKGALLGTKKYLDIIEQCNCIIQISAVCDSYNKMESGCPTYAERLEIARKVASRGKRVIIRIQPYLHEVYQEVYDALERVADTGAYGIIIEGMKHQRKHKGTVRVAGDWCIDYKTIKHDFLNLKKRGNELGLKVYAGENRLRAFGDSLTCCGIDGLEGFVPNTFNLNHLVHGDKTYPTEAQKRLVGADVLEH